MLRGDGLRMSSAAVACWILFVAQLAFGQAPPALTFEVASIKPAEAITPAMIAAGKLNVGMSVNGSRMSIGYMSLADLIQTAYKLKPFQVSGPDWMRNQRFDIVAKLPEGATKDEVPEMLQGFLQERFHLKVHHEKRESPVYALVVSKDGHKLRPSPPDTDPAPPAPGAITIGAAGGQVSVNPTRGGATMFAPDGGKTTVSMGQDGQMHMEMSKVTMAALADMLTPFVDRPVVDMTELKGNYQAALDLTIDVLAAMAQKAGVAIPAFGARGAPGGIGNASDPSSSSLFASVQQLGLKMESRKAPVDFVVVDDVDKMPTEN
jgi:uncharacterized protein (TIGR03435 family)